MIAWSALGNRTFSTKNQFGDAIDCRNKTLDLPLVSGKVHFVITVKISYCHIWQSD